MQLSELIQELQRQVQKSGDAEVWVQTEDSGTEYNDIAVAYDNSPPPDGPSYTLMATVDKGVEE